MNPSGGTFHDIARHLVLVFAPLKVAVSDLPEFRTLLYRLAWDVQSLPPEYIALGEKVDVALAGLEALGDTPSPAEIFDVLDSVKSLYTALRGITSVPDGADAAVFLQEIGQSLVDLLLVDYLVAEHPGTLAALRALGIVVQETTEQTSTRPRVVRNRILWDEIPRVLTEPDSIPERLYGWGTDDLRFPPLAAHLLEFFITANWPAYISRVDEALQFGFMEAPDDLPAPTQWQLKIPVLMSNIAGEEVEVGLALLELPAESGKPAGLVLQPLVPSVMGQTLDISSDLKLELRAGSDVSSTFGVLLRPNDISVKFPFQAGQPLPAAGFGVQLRYAPESPALLLGASGKSRLEIKGATTSFDLDFREGDLELRFQAAPQDLKVIIAAADLDGFLGQLLGSGERSIPIALALQWSNRTGFNFMGGAGFEVSTHPHLSAGPLRIERIDLGIKSTFGSSQPPDVKAEVGLTVGGNLGPISFSAEGLGLDLTLLFAEGNAGPFDVQVGFKPPHGLGLLVDAGPISGGGFLSFDKAQGRYSGALELDVFGTSIKAIGFVDTKVPEGGSGFSFVILISTEFAPIQLGLGFTLNGVGGLAALHRGIAVEPLQSGLRTGSLNSLLFPSNPIADAPRIISELGIIFPHGRNRHVFGPMAKIGWGTPTLIRAELGVLLELPAPFRLTLLGLITARLPSEQAPVIKLNVAVLGRVDFGKKTLAIDASLFDSSLAGFPVSGDMAVRLAWGDRPSFILAMGGLNPNFDPPPGFPTLQRLTLILGTGENPRLTCQAYLAVTSNTLQFGVKAELYAAAAGFNVKGWISFDCLIQFSPFSLIAELSAEVAFRRGSSVLASVHLDATLTGPAPWHVKGKASLSLWLFDVSVKFDVTFGQSRPQALPPVDPWPLLQAAIQDVRNWTSAIPAGAFQAVTLSAPSSPDVPELIEPGGAATLQQKVVPLNRKITRFGAATPVGPDRYAVDVNAVAMNGSTADDVVTITDYFAAAQFEAMSDTEKLSRASFEHMDAGIRLAGDAVTSGAAVGTELEYDTKIIDTPWAPPRPSKRYKFLQIHQFALLQGRSSDRRGSFQATGLAKFAPPVAKPSKVALEDDLYVIAGTADLAVVPGLARGMGKGAALAALASHLKNHPEDRGRLQVMPEEEAVLTP